MPRDTARLRVQLAQHLDDLCRLEVVEAAEEVVRQRHLRLVRGELAGLRDDLTLAQQNLGVARDGDELTSIVEAEERMCEVLRQTAILQRLAGEHIRASTRVQNAYLVRREWLVARIDQLRHLVA